MKPQSKDMKWNALAARLAKLSTTTAIGIASIVTAANAAATKPSDALPKLKTNQAYVETVTRPTKLKTDDPMSVFAFVHSSLPDKVTVYPSENYFYFSFMHQGHEYAGNLRLDIADRDKGHVHFAYFRKYTEWRRGGDPTYGLLGKEHGVSVKKAGALAYDISHKGKTVRFNLVDVSHVKPPKAAVGADEKYLGPVYDESGIQFYLMFNARLKVFHYVLNEQVRVGEMLIPSEVSKDITIGQRTGFAYYNDPYLKRKILIGVHASNSRVNNYFDGPFDQLPDNFIKGNELRDAILAVEPALKGKIDRLGNSPDGATRYYIGPYMHYEDEGQLSVVADCMADKTVTRGDYALCLVIEDNDESNTEHEQPAENAPADETNTGSARPAPAKP